MHVCEIDSFQVGDQVLAIVDEKLRLQTERNHSSAHLFHQALKEVLGDHAIQQGQQVNAKSCRFDFNHYESMNDETILKLETLVNTYIQTNPLDVNIYETTLEDAKQKGAMALFGEKYGDHVRVVDMGWSIELCGGTHVKNTKSIINFTITSLSSIGSGIFRMEGISGDQVIAQMQIQLNPFLIELKAIQDKIDQENYDFKLNYPTIKGSYEDIITYRHYLETVRRKVKELEKSKVEKDQQNVLSLVDVSNFEKNQDISVIQVEHIEKKLLKALVDQLFDHLQSGTLILINKEEEKASYVIKSSNKLASVLVKKIASMTEGSGGGQDHFAQGGTTRLDLIDDAIKALIL